MADAPDVPGRSETVEVSFLIKVLSHIAEEIILAEAILIKPRSSVYISGVALIVLYWFVFRTKAAHPGKPRVNCVS